MKLTLEPTSEFFMAGDVMVRLWQGIALGPDGDSQQCIALITLVAFPGQGQAAVEGLVSIPPPTAKEAKAWAEAVLRHHQASRDD